MVATMLLFVFVILLGFISGIFAIVKTEFSTTCMTPNNIEGLCVEIKKCSVFMDALISGKNESFDFIRESRCGSLNDTRQPKVCCGAHDDFLYKTKTNKRFGISQRNLFPENCGIQDDSERIFGGIEASFGEFPWMARLRHRRSDGRFSYGCAGFLISDKFVLTAAHCVRSKVLEPLGHIYQVQLGEHDTETDPDCEKTTGTTEPICVDTPQLIKNAEPIVHPEYFGGSQNYNDIAIIPLKEPAKFTDFVFPICLSQVLSQGSPMWLSGWGRTETGRASSKKLKTYVPKVSKTQCTGIYKPIGISILDSQICAGGEAGRDSCTGDSGGPLMVFRDFWYAEGIVSFGKGCGEKGWPGVYTSIPYHLPWIEKAMNKYLDGKEEAEDIRRKIIEQEYVIWSW